MLDLNSLINRARFFAFAAHAGCGQVRKYTKEPYFVHCEAVARLVAATGAGNSVIAAALLHDVVEDTKITYADILIFFGTIVALLVQEVSDVSRPEDGNRAMRKALDRAHYAKASPFGQTIKLADLIDNSKDIGAHDPDFAKVFMGEMSLLLDVLTLGDAGLLEQAREIVRDYQNGPLQAALAKGGTR